MLLILAATSSVAIADGPEYNFTTTDNGSTLVINGKGDLTSANRVLTNQDVFTNNAVGTVFADAQGALVTAGAPYFSASKYYLKVKKYTESVIDGAPSDGDYFTETTFSATWKDNAATGDTYIYPVTMSTQNEWNGTGTNLYSVTNVPTVEKWKESVLNDTYLYPVTYNERRWDTTKKTSSVYVYKAQTQTTSTWDNEKADYVYTTKTYVRSDEISDDNIEGDKIHTSQTGDNTEFYIYTNTKLSIDNPWYVYQEISEGDFSYVPSDWIVEPSITISGERITSGDYPGDGSIETYTHEGTQYKDYVTSTTAKEEDATFLMTALEGEGITKIADMSSYHYLPNTVTIAGGPYTTGVADINTSEFSYIGQNYLYYATSESALNVNDVVEIENITLLQGDAIDAYYDSKNVLTADTRVASGDTYDRNRTAISYNGTDYVGYVKLSSTWPEGTVYDNNEAITYLTKSGVENYLDVTASYKVKVGNLAVSTDGGETMTDLSQWSVRNYTVGETFHTSYDGYDPIADNDTYFAEPDHESYLTNQASVTITFKQDLLAQINSGSYTKVVFNNTTEDKTALTIDPEIAQIILFPNKNANNTITELDLGEATTTSPEHLLDHPDVAWKRADNLAKVTLPLVAAVGGKVELPANVIPSVYNTDPANLKTITVPNGYTKIGNDAFSTDGGYGSSKITHINLPEGLTEIGDKAFYSITHLTNINITDAEVEGRSIVFPSTVATIGESAFEGCTSLTSTASDPFKLPSGLKKIKKSAFINLTNLKFLQLNEGLEYVGNTAFGLMSEVHDQTTITFPSTLKYLGPGSFISRWYQDIYFTGEKAPVCPVGKSAFTDWGNVTAFSANTQMGNNGFNPYKTTGSTADDASNTGYANRENYVGSGGYYFTILHFPDGLTSDQAKTYRDITRRYVTCPEGTTFSYGGDISGVNDPATPGYTFGEAFKETVNGKTSSLVYYMSGGGTLYVYTNSANVQPGYIDTYLGRQQIWPSQSQWQRNFVTVANGMEWDGETQYRPEVTEDMFTMMKDDGLWVQANSLDYTDGKSRIPYGSDGKLFSLEDKTSYASLTTNEKDYLSLILYQGTRRFVLSYDGGYDIPFIIPMQGGLWWSICLPFSLTKEKVDDIFGVGTHVCLMSAVDRTVTQDSNGQNTLVLKFKNDVYRHKTERTSSTTTITTTDENGKSTTTSAKVYTYASNFDKTAAAPGSDDVVIYARESYMIFPTKDNNDAAQRNFGSPVFETGDPLPTMVQVNREDDSNGQYYISGSDPVYRFIGNFNTTAGYGGTSTNITDDKGNVVGTTTAVSVKIPQYSYAYGKMNNQRKFFILNTANATWSPFKSIVQNTAVGGGADDWNNFFQKTTARVNQVSLFGDDEEVTGIENVIIEVSSDNDEDLRVFNLNGMQMGNSLQGLPAGTYIQGGKAYRVK